MKKRVPRPFHPAAYAQATSDYARNRLLLDWLSDDQARAAFYAAHGKTPLFTFPSRAEDEADTCGDARHQPGVPARRRNTHLVLDRDLIEDVLRDQAGAPCPARVPSLRFSNLPYARIGSGGFMLALDPAVTGLHALQRQVATQVFGTVDLDRLCQLAVQQASTIALRADAFDLAQLAEQAALRFCCLYFGFALKDFPYLEAAMRAAYAALVHTNLGRHFVSDPLVLKAAELPMGVLARRCAELIDEYALLGVNEWPEDGMAPPGKWSYQPVMRQLAMHAGGQLTGSQMAVLVVGTLAGTVGNIQAATCIAVEALLKTRNWQGLTPQERSARCAQAWAQNPPVPFLPRRVLHADARWKALGVQDGDDLVLAIGAATRGKPSKAPIDPLVFTEGATHDCLGRHLALPLVDELVAHVLALPGLARRLDPVLGTPMPLDKHRGFQCTSLPLTHRRQQLRLQQPLNVAMRVKSPISENAAKLRETIRVAGPRIDEALREAGMVHFAWFEFNDADSVLVLHTVYDGDFDAYIEHFALSVGELFDLLFEYIESAPPRPVAEHPFEFVELIRRFNRPPTSGYFFSAYPALQTQQCLRMEQQQTARTVRPACPHRP